jgi:tetratricopeptide (TPR) repeat protein
MPFKSDLCVCYNDAKLIKRFDMKKLFVVFALLCAVSSCYAVPESYRDAMDAGSIAVYTGTYEEAKSDFAKALSLAKTNGEKAGALFFMGNMSFLQEKYADARAIFDKVLAINQIDPTTKFHTYLFYAESYSAEGKYHEARLTYNKALSINMSPQELIAAQAEKAGTYLSNKQYAQAREEYGKIRAYKTFISVAADVLADDYIGESFLAEGNFAAARKQFANGLMLKQKKTTSNNNSQQDNNFLFDLYQHEAQFDIAESYFKEKKYAKAKEEYNKVLRMKDPNFKGEAKRQIIIIEKLLQKSTPNSSKSKSH